MFSTIPRRRSVVTLFLVTLALTATEVKAGGGFGSVWPQNTTKDSITVNWSSPSDPYRNCASPPRHEVCIKKAGSAVDTCRNFSLNTTTKPFTFSGLDAETRYKIKIYTKAEKKNLWGRYRNCKMRKVGTAKIETKKKPAPLTYSLQVTDVSDSSLSVRVDFSQPQTFTRLSVCYKKTWYPFMLENECKSGQPLAVQVPNYGTDTVMSPSPPWQVEFDNLSSCRAYKIVAYGTLAGSQTLVKVGETVVKTSGDCGIFKTTPSDIIDTLLTDHDQIAYSYYTSLAGFYGTECPTGVLSHLVDQYPILAEEIGGMGAESVDVIRRANLLEYLVELHPDDVLNPWQEEPALKEGGLDVSSWMSERHPELYKQIIAEATGDPKPCRWTRWLNRDAPGGKGDFELLKDFIDAGKACRSPEGIQCQTLGGMDWRRTGEKYSCTPERGGVCLNRDQDDKKCENYRVRFRCCAQP